MFDFSVWRKLRVGVRITIAYKVASDFPSSSVVAYMSLNVSVVPLAAMLIILVDLSGHYSRT